MIESNYKREFETIAKYYEKTGADASKLLRKDIVSIIVSGDKVIGRNTVEGVELKATPLENGVDLFIKVNDNVTVNNPVHLCTGYLKPEGVQNVIINMEIGNNSKVDFIGHCVFPSGVNFTHKMVSFAKLGDGAEMSYEDTHFHSEDGGVTVEASYIASVGKGSKYSNFFRLTKTRVGKLNIEMKVDLDDKAIANLESKVYEREDDEVRITEEISLNGEASSGLAKTIVFATDQSKAHIVNKAYGNAPYSKGHIECNEIIKGDNVSVGTIPELYVKNEKAELTHEASIGRVNIKQLETLMAKGLDEEEATDLIISGMLK